MPVLFRGEKLILNSGLKALRKTHAAKRKGGWVGGNPRASFLRLYYLPIRCCFRRKCARSAKTRRVAQRIAGCNKREAPGAPFKGQLGRFVLIAGAHLMHLL